MAVLEIITSVILVMSLFMSVKHHRWWLVYSAGNVLFFIVALQDSRYSYCGLGVIFFITGIRNYFEAAWKETIKPETIEELQKEIKILKRIQKEDAETNIKATENYNRLCIKQDTNRRFGEN